MQKSGFLFVEKSCKWHSKLSLLVWCYPLHCYKFGPLKFFSKSFKFSITFYSSWQFSGGGQWRKACRSREKESIQSEIMWKQSELVRSISKIEKRKEFVRALWYEQCPKNYFKRLYTLKGLLVLVEKASFSKEFRSEFHSGGGGYLLFNKKSIWTLRLYGRPWRPSTNWMRLWTLSCPFPQLLPAGLARTTLPHHSLPFWSNFVLSLKWRLMVNWEMTPWVSSAGELVWWEGKGGGKRGWGWRRGRQRGMEGRWKGSG